MMLFFERVQGCTEIPCYLMFVLCYSVPANKDEETCRQEIWVLVMECSLQQDRSFLAVTEEHHVSSNTGSKEMLRSPPGTWDSPDIVLESRLLVGVWLGNGKSVFSERLCALTSAIVSLTCQEIPKIEVGL